MSINGNTINFNAYSNVTNIYIPDSVVTNNKNFSNKYKYMNIKSSYIGGGY